MAWKTEIYTENYTVMCESGLKINHLCCGSWRKASEGEQEAVCGTAVAWQGYPEGHLGR